MNRKIDYLQISDDDLAYLAHNGDDSAMEVLLIKYKSFVKVRASRMYIAGGERDDVIQEGMIGLFKAVRAFDISRKSSFSALASVCIMSQIKDAVRTASTNKQAVLNDSVFSEELQDHISDDSPDKKLISREDFRELWKFIDKEMTPFEKKALLLVSSGYSYSTVSEMLSKTVKSIDGAVQRARKKLGKFRRTE